MVTYAVWVVVPHEGHEILEEFEGFEGVEDLVEPEDLELLVQWVGPEDLVNWPLFFLLCIYFLLLNICLVCVSFKFSLLNYNNQDLFCFSFEIPDEPQCYVR